MSTVPPMKYKQRGRWMKGIGSGHFGAGFVLKETGILDAFFYNAGVEVKRLYAFILSQTWPVCGCNSQRCIFIGFGPVSGQ